MPWILQMLAFGLLLVGIAIALWVSLWLLVFLFAVGLLAVLWSHLRDYLIAQGILNPRPGFAPDSTSETTHITLIEGEFERVDAPEKEENKAE